MMLMMLGTRGQHHEQHWRSSRRKMWTPKPQDKKRRETESQPRSASVRRTGVQQHAINLRKASEETPADAHDALSGGSETSDVRTL